MLTTYIKYEPILFCQYIQARKGQIDNMFIVQEFALQWG